jgi:hypothetical protein
MANREKEEASASIRTYPRRLCPFVKEPFDECLCSGTGSDSAEATIRLCGGSFESCEIFRERRWERQVES